nr:polyprenol monophosphomannose synthase [Candidatus Sigynarchaeota archaeon]
MSKGIYELPESARFVKISSVSLEKQSGNDKTKRTGEKIAIVLPTYNERKNLQLLIPGIEDIFDRYGINGHLIIVDDKSMDGTADIAIRFARAYRNITVIQRPGKLGLGSAYRFGFKQALKMGMDLIFEMDADLSHRPSYIPKFIACLKKYDADLVIGSRYCKRGSTENWPFLRKLISFGANFFTHIALGVSQTRDMTSGFRIYKAKTLQAIDYNALTTNGYAWQIETLYRTKLVRHKIREIPIIFHEREFGLSKLGRDDVKEFVFFLFKAFLYRISRVLR